MFFFFSLNILILSLPSPIASFVAGASGEAPCRVFAAAGGALPAAAAQEGSDPARAGGRRGLGLWRRSRRALASTAAAGAAALAAADAAEAEGGGEAECGAAGSEDEGAGEYFAGSWMRGEASGLVWGHPSRSGKLATLAAILPIWRQQGHKVTPSFHFLSFFYFILLFTHLSCSMYDSYFFSKKFPACEIFRCFCFVKRGKCYPWSSLG